MLMSARPLSALDHPRWLKPAPAIFLLLWSSGFVFLKLGLQYADPLTFLALRYACVIGILLVAALWIRPRLPDSPRAWLRIATIGLLIQAGYFSFMYLCLKTGVSAGAAALITSQQPILVGLLAPVIAGEPVDLKRWAGLALGVSGAIWVIAARSTIDVTSVIGFVFAVLSLVAMTAGTLLEKRFDTRAHPITTNLIQYAVGLAVSAPLAYALEPMHIEWTTGLIGSLAYLVVFNSIIAITLLLAMIRFGEASRVSALFFLVPPMTTLIARVVLGEPVPVLVWPGMALAAAGLYLVMRDTRRTA
jgi:drug/metabolite transporter (DMT)-like permease